MNGFEIKYYKSFKVVRDLWQQQFDKVGDSYFIAPAWHQIVLNLHGNRLLSKRLSKICYFSFNAIETNDMLILGFFVITKKKGVRVIEFSPIVGPSDYYDLLLSENVNEEMIDNAIKNIAKEYEASEIHFAHVKENSKLGNYFKNCDSEITSLDCVKIDIPREYDNYFKMLSKSVRQNIRTAYNRINKDLHLYNLQIYKQGDLKEINFFDLLNLYNKRNEGRKEKLHWKSLFLNKINHVFSPQKDIFELTSLKQTDYTLGVLTIDSKIAAYFFGYSINGRIEINRVVINEQFRFYSPGLILINEFIKYGIENNLREVDLTVGDEKYKYDLGGKTHKILNGKIKLR